MSTRDRPDTDASRDRAVPEPDAPPTAEELHGAERLRRALERGRPDAPGDAEWATVEAIRAANAPAPLDPRRQREILAAALENGPRGKVIYWAFGGVAGLAAMAAAFALFVRGSEPSGGAELAVAPSTPLAISRSTEPLFPEGIPVTGGASERVGRIAYARARDLRENRFARWGVR